MIDRHILFTADFFAVPPERRSSGIQYKAGWKGRIRAIFAERAVAAGAAIYVDPKTGEPIDEDPADKTEAPDAGAAGAKKRVRRRRG